MKYVYILQSIKDPSKFYVGLTNNLKRRFLEHNNNTSVHSNKFAPWKIKTYVAFSDDEQASAFEKYLKTASGRAFSMKRL